MYVLKNCDIFRLPNIFLSGKIIEYVKEFTYLGRILSDDLSDDADIMNQNRKLCARGNMVARNFKSCSIDIKRLLFLTYCSTIYCCALWTRYRQLTLNRLRVNYNNILRRMVNIPSFSSASQLFALLDLRSFVELRRRASYSIMSRLQNSRNEVVGCVINSDAKLRSNFWTYWYNTLFIVDD